MTQVCSSLLLAEESEGHTVDPCVLDRGPERRENGSTGFQVP